MTESQPRPTPQENQPFTTLVDVMAKVGYSYEMETTHTDRKGNLYFKKPIGEELFPHFQAVYKTDRNRIQVYIINFRSNETKLTSYDLTDELKRLRGHFILLSQSPNQEIATLATHLERVSFSDFGDLVIGKTKLLCIF